MNLIEKEITEDIINYSELNFNNPKLPFITGLSSIEIDKQRIESILSIKIGEYFCHPINLYSKDPLIYQYAGRIVL